MLFRFQFRHLSTFLVTPLWKVRYVIQRSVQALVDFFGKYRCGKSVMSTSVSDESDTGCVYSGEPQMWWFSTPKYSVLVQSSSVMDLPSVTTCYFYGSKLYLLSNHYSLLFVSLLDFIWISGTPSSEMHGQGSSITTSLEHTIYLHTILRRHSNYYVLVVV